MPQLQTEFEFTLPKGYVSSDGSLHKKGRMRLATALDEIAPLRDPRVRANEAYLVVIVLARVVIQLGTLEFIDTGVMEKLFTADVAYLQELYRKINGFESESDNKNLNGEEGEPPGGSSATP